MSAGRALLDPLEILPRLGLHPGHVLVDFGIGHSAHFSLTAARLVGETGKVYAVDILEHYLEQLAQRAALERQQNIVPIRGDFEAQIAPLPLENNIADFVVSVLNAACLQNFSALAKEARRLLKDDGKLLLIDWKPEVNHPVAPRVELRRGIYDAKHDLLNTGFTQAEEVRINRHHWGLLISNT